MSVPKRLVKDEEYVLQMDDATGVTATFVERKGDDLVFDMTTPSGPTRIRVDRTSPGLTITPPSFAKKLALVNTKAKLPPELLAVIHEYVKPGAKKRPYPGTERQREATKRALTKTRAEVPGEDELAVGRGRRKTRRRHRR